MPRTPKKPIELTEEQKKLVEANHDRLNLTELTKLCFANDSLTGRHAEGRAIRKYLIENALFFKTTEHERVEGLELTDEQKEIARELAERDLSTLKIAEHLFPNQKIKKLGIEQRAVLEYLKDNDPVYANERKLVDEARGYTPPRTMAGTIRKINKAAGENLIEDKLQKRQETCIKVLKKNLTNSRFVAMMNSFASKTDAQLFEDEFVRLTWDKPDLTADEINLYLNVCKDIVHLETISSQLYKLNSVFGLSGDEFDQGLMNAIRVKTTEYNNCESRIEDLIKKLQGDRAERIKNKRAENASILSIVAMFQDEEERQHIAKMAKLKQMDVRKEVERLESMDEWKARVLGISQDDVI